MGLRLTKNIKGHDFGYWKIARFSIDDVKKKIVAKLALYKDRDYRIDNSDGYVELKTFIWEEDDYVFSVTRSLDSSDILKAIYNKIKEPILKQKTGEDGEKMVDDEGNPITENVNEFSDAEDVLEDVS